MEAEIKEMLYDVFEKEICDIQSFINRKKLLDNTLRNLFTNSPRLLESIRNYIEDLFYDKRIDNFDADNYAKYIDCILNEENTLSPEINPNFGYRFGDNLKENIERYQIIQTEEIKRSTMVIAWNILGEREEFPFDSSTENTTTFDISSFNSNESIESNSEILNDQKYNRAVINFVEFMGDKRIERIKKGLYKIKKANLKEEKTKISSLKYREIVLKHLASMIKKREIFESLQIMMKGKLINKINEEKNNFKYYKVVDCFIWWAYKLELKKVKMTRIKLGANLIEAKLKNNHNQKLYKSFYVQKYNNRESKYQNLSKFNYGIFILCKWELFKKWSNKYIFFSNLKAILTIEKMEEIEYVKSRNLRIYEIIKVINKFQKIYEIKHQSESFLRLKIISIQKSNEITEEIYIESEKGIFKKQKVKNATEKINLKYNLMIKLAFDRLKNYSLAQKSNYERLYAINLLNIINLFRNYQNGLIAHAYMRLKINSMAGEIETFTETKLKSQSRKIGAKKISASHARLEKSAISNVLTQWKSNTLNEKLLKLSKACIAKNDLKATNVIFSTISKSIKIPFLKWRDLAATIKTREFWARKIGESILNLIRKRLGYSYWHIQYWNDFKKWSFIRKIITRANNNIKTVESLIEKHELDFNNRNLLSYRIKEHALSYDKMLILLNCKNRDINASIFQANEKLMALRAQNASSHNKFISIAAKNKQESEKIKKLQVKFQKMSADQLKLNENISSFKQHIEDCKYHIQNLRKNIRVTEAKLKKKSINAQDSIFFPFLNTYDKLLSNPFNSSNSLNSNFRPFKIKKYQKDIKILNKSSIIATIILIFLLFLLII